MENDKKFKDLEKENKKEIKLSSFFKGKDETNLNNLENNNKHDKKEENIELNEKTKKEKKHAFGGFFKKHKDNLDNDLNNHEHDANNKKEENKEVYTDKNFDEFFKEEIQAKQDELEVKPRRKRSAISLAIYVAISFIVPVILFALLNAVIIEKKSYVDYAYENVNNDKSLLYIIEKEFDTKNNKENVKELSLSNNGYKLLYNKELGDSNINEEKVKKLLLGENIIINNTNLSLRIPANSKYKIKIEQDSNNLKEYLDFNETTDIKKFKNEDIFVFTDKELYEKLEKNNYFIETIKKVKDYDSNKKPIYEYIYFLINNPDFIKKPLSGYNTNKISSFIQLENEYKTYITKNNFNGKIYIDNKLKNIDFFFDIQNITKEKVISENKKEVINLVSSSHDDTFKGTIILVLVNFLTLLTSAIALIILLFREMKKDAFSIKKNYVKFIICVIVCVFLLFSTGILTDLLNNVITQNTNLDLTAESVNQASLVNMFSNPLNITFMVLTTVVLAPIVEELVFRKIIFNIINKDKIAIIVSGLTFGIIHVFHEPSFLSFIIHLVPYALSGIGMSIAYKYSGKNIWVSIIGHSISNFIAVMFILIK